MRTPQYNDEAPSRKEFSSMNSILESRIRTIVEYKPTMPKGIHSELHEMVARLRKEFGETAKKGKGSFGFYLKLLKPVPISLLHIWLANINDSAKILEPIDKCKLFWWKWKTWRTGK